MGKLFQQGRTPAPARTAQSLPYEAAVLLVACLSFLGTIVSPPSLLDDADATYAQVARTMLDTGDWVTARLDGVVYLDKAPLHPWAMAVSFAIFGANDWAARIPLALASVVLCWVVFRFAAWAFSLRAGLFAGLSLATCLGMFLFTRVRIPDAALALSVTVALWSFLRATDEQETHHRWWAALLAVCLGLGLLLKGLVGIVLPAGAIAAYLLVTRQMFSASVWKRLRIGWGLGIVLLVAGPWHWLAILANPPYFDFTMESRPGVYRGFFWRYFINEHLLRYLGLRYPRDYDTVPLLPFWLLQLAWLFPWSAFLPASAGLGYGPETRAGRTRLLALCWAGFVLLFFSFSTRQEYYTLPCYAALALLIGSAVDRGGKWVRHGSRALSLMAAVGAAAACALLFLTWGMPAPGDISQALARHPEAYTLSLGHMGDLTLEAFAYLRLPLALAAAGFALGSAGTWRFSARVSAAGLALMMLLFVHAARLAMVEFDPYLSSRRLAQALDQSPPGDWIADREYYAFSSVFFYSGRQGLLLNGRKNQLEYGAHAPGAPGVFLTDQELAAVWTGGDRYYLATFEEDLPRIEALVSRDRLHIVEKSGGKVLFSNLPVGPAPGGPPGR